MVDIYRAPGSNSVVLQRNRRTSSIGSAVARGLGEVGAVAQDMVDNRARTDEEIEQSEFRIAKEEQRRERSRRAAGFYGDLSTRRVEYARWQSEARSDTAPGAPGWEDTATAKIDELFGPLIDTWAGDDTELVDQFSNDVIRVTSSMVINELDWEDGQRAVWEAEQFDMLVQTERDGLLSAPITDVGEALDNSMATIMAAIKLTDHDGTTKARFLMNAQAQLVTGAFDRIADEGAWDQMEALLDSGKYDGLLGKAKGNYLNTIEAGRAADARAAEQEASARRDEWRTQRNVIKQKLDRGEAVNPSEVAAMVASGKALGIPDDELQALGYLAQDAVYSKSATRMDDPTLRTTIKSLQAKRAAGEASTEEIRMLDALEGELGQRDTVKAAKIPGLGKGTPEERFAAVAELRGMNETERYRVARAGGAGELALIAALPERTAGVALEGLQVIANDKDAYMPANAQGNKSADMLERYFAEFLGPAMFAELRATAEYKPALAAAKALYVGAMARENRTAFHQASFENAVNTVFGARGAKGGIRNYRGRKVQVPDGRTAAYFENYVSRLTFKTAIYSEGAPANKADVLKNFTPAYVGQTEDGKPRYEMRDSKGRALLLQDKSGPWWFTVPRVR